MESVDWQHPMENLTIDYESTKHYESPNERNSLLKRSKRNQIEAEELSPHDHLQSYLHEIKHYRLLSRKEEFELAQRVREQNDEEAVTRLVMANLRLVVKIAKDMGCAWRINLLDLIQEGNIGLMKAARKFDPDRGVKFSYYASYWIKAYMLKFIMDNWRMVKIGTTQSQRRLFFSLSRGKHRLRREAVNPEPTLIAKRFNVREEEVVEMTQRMEGRDLLLNSPIDDHSKETHERSLKDPGTAIDDQLSRQQRKMIFLDKLKGFRERLPKREAYIFDSRIMAEEPIVLREIGEKYHISKERVRQIHRRIIENIEEWSREEIPNFEEDYAGLSN
jgi:RNA polymerase sigma-32 factor